MAKRHKYGATKTNGYDSKKEYNRSTHLKLMQRSGIITDLKEQVPFELLPAQYVKDHSGKEICGRRAMKYIADFTYYQKGVYIVEDVKGYRTKEYKRKANLMLKIHGIHIKET
jgi:hypothetical protein